MTPRPSWIRSRRAAVLLVVVLVAITGGVATAATLLLSSKTLTTGTKSVSVPLFQPTLTAVANPSATTTPGASLSDVATLSNGTTGATGFIVYKLFGPGNATCTGAPVASPSVAVTGNANYTASPAPAPTALGTYQWTVGYVGDSKNSPAPNPTPTCGNGGSVVLAAANTFHISNITAAPAQNNTNSYHSSVTVTVVDGNGAALSGVTVPGSWSGGTAGGNCGATTTSAGVCTVASANNSFTDGTSYTWTAGTLTKSLFTYAPAANVYNKITIFCPSSGTCTATPAQ